MFVLGKPFQPSLVFSDKKTVNYSRNKFYDTDPCGLYYKQITIVNDDASVVFKWSFKLIDAARGVIYDCHMFIVQATGWLTFPT